MIGTMANLQTGIIAIHGAVTTRPLGLQNSINCVLQMLMVMVSMNLFRVALA